MQRHVAVAFASLFGTMAEDFDWLLASYAAALAWPKIFFPTLIPSAAYLASISTFLVSFVARPLGSFLFGHLADTRGRRSTLIYTLVTMGGAGFLIGVLPGAASLGILAPTLLAILRFIQGLGWGGEWGSVTSWIVEEARNSRFRAFWSSFVPLGYVLGGIAAAGGVTLMTLYNLNYFITYGWRILYIIGAITIIIGAIIRYRVSESYLFEELISSKKTLKLPAIEVFKQVPGTVFKMACVNLVAQTPVYIGISALIIYLVRVIHLPPSLTTYAALLGTALGGLLVFITSYAADKVGRKPVLIAVYTFILIYSIPFVYMINTGIKNYVLIADSIMISTAFAAVTPIAAFIAENYETKYRASGTGLSYQIGVILGVLPQTYIITYLISYGKTYSLGIGLVLMVSALISLIATLMSKETIKEKIGAEISELKPKEQAQQ